MTDEHYDEEYDDNEEEYDNDDNDDISLDENPTPASSNLRLDSLSDLVFSLNKIISYNNLSSSLSNEEPQLQHTPQPDQSLQEKVNILNHQNIHRDSVYCVYASPASGGFDPLKDSPFFDLDNKIPDSYEGFSLQVCSNPSITSTLPVAQCIEGPFCKNCSISEPYSFVIGTINNGTTPYAKIVFSKTQAVRVELPEGSEDTKDIQTVYYDWKCEIFSLEDNTSFGHFLMNSDEDRYALVRSFVQDFITEAHNHLSLNLSCPEIIDQDFSLSYPIPSSKTFKFSDLVVS